ncbi:hypothetical protein M427DRAFT_55453 [Gonapodya prolifera JEL478]|uniref:Uncharacterized protein n=1 Tax=Gonapodya prolifera (strain JEL478) TaxID=1344416 RepID=A0A139AI53_GONPJ|nr:hypothetical protein M427DRAFT_55453 [Gonapodya prolifera JEL478]|eukprot:KXS16501.1 hypothetical protein M427DRAFT_55453 [Gonapodya prolifera JEL478]
MEKWHPGRVMAGVTILRTTNIRLDEVMPISAFAATLEILLRMFPNADTLETEIRVFSTSAADKLIRCIPDARRRKITSLRDWSRIPLDFDDTSGSLNILHLARVFPNLQRLSHVRLSSTYSSSITSLEPLASESPQSIQFDHLESITIEIDSTNALDFVKVGLSSKRVSLILDGLANHAPLLKEVVLILKLFICPGEPLDEPNAAILAVADQLFVTAVTRPTFVIQEVIESIDHQTEIFETKRETLEGCREDKTKMLILDLEKLAVKRGVFWRWLRR